VTAQTGMAVIDHVSINTPSYPWRHPLLNEPYHAASATKLNRADQTAKRPRLPRRDSLNNTGRDRCVCVENAWPSSRPNPALRLAFATNSAAWRLCAFGSFSQALLLPAYRRNAFLSGCRRKSPKGVALARCKPLPPRTQENCRQAKGRQFSCVPVPREGAFRLLPQSRRWAGLQQLLQPEPREEKHEQDTAFAKRSESITASCQIRG
jgi:hypothetical protein